MTFTREVGLRVPCGNRVVTQFGQSAPFGAAKPQVRILPTRLKPYGFLDDDILLSRKGFLWLLEHQQKWLSL